jgi:hypothetical protein
LKVLVNTDRLRLPGGGSAELWPPGPQPERRRPPRAIRAEAVRELLQLGVTPIEIRRLVRRIEEESRQRAAEEAWPSQADDRKVLCAVSDLAEALACIFQGASPRARAEIAEAASDPWLPSVLQAQLKQLAGSLRRRTEQPLQPIRREAPRFLPIAVQDVIGHRIGNPSKWPASPFRRACVAAFALTGRTGSPDRAIEAAAQRRAAER